MFEWFFHLKNISPIFWAQRQVCGWDGGSPFTIWRALDTNYILEYWRGKSALNWIWWKSNNKANKTIKLYHYSFRGQIGSDGNLFSALNFQIIANPKISFRLDQSATEPFCGAQTVFFSNGIDLQQVYLLQSEAHLNKTLMFICEYFRRHGGIKHWPFQMEIEKLAFSKTLLLHV